MYVVGGVELGLLYEALGYIRLKGCRRVRTRFVLLLGMDRELPLACFSILRLSSSCEVALELFRSIRSRRHSEGVGDW